MSGSDHERDVLPRRPMLGDDRLSRDIRQDITVVKARAQLLRRLLRRGTLHATELDHGLAEIERAIDRLHARIRPPGDDPPSPG